MSQPGNPARSGARRAGDARISRVSLVLSPGFSPPVRSIGDNEMVAERRMTRPTTSRNAQARHEGHRAVGLHGLHADPSVAAISLVLLPSAIICRTSRWRGVGGRGGDSACPARAAKRGRRAGPEMRELVHLAARGATMAELEALSARSPSRGIPTRPALTARRTELLGGVHGRMNCGFRAPPRCYGRWPRYR
jgi:hypothetical protein